jgi:hypothetical protein
VESKSKNTKRIPKTQPLVLFSPLSFLSPAAAKSQKDDALKPPSFLPFIPTADPENLSLFFFFLSFQLLHLLKFLLFFSFFCRFSLPFSPAATFKNLCFFFFFFHLFVVSSPFSLFSFSFLFLHLTCRLLLISRSSCCLLFSLGLCPIQDPRKFSFCPSAWSFFPFLSFLPSGSFLSFDNITHQPFYIL